MTEQEFITQMRVLFSVWRDTENADQILTDVVATIGSQCFDKHGLELRALEAECGSAMRAEFAPVPQTDAYKDYLVKSAKFCEALQDSFFAPKR